jgi:uncharacterized OB-fold protein
MMNTKVISATTRAIDFNADATTRAFYAALRERRFRGTRCTGCGYMPFPPKEHCVRCAPAAPGHRMEWIELPTRGMVYAFTQQQRSWRFSKPDVIGLVSLVGVAGLVLTKLDAPIASLAIGQEVEVDFLDVGPELVVHQFRPVVGR